MWCHGVLSHHGVICNGLLHCVLGHVTFHSTSKTVGLLLRGTDDVIWYAFLRLAVFGFVRSSNQWLDLNLLRLHAHVQCEWLVLLLAFLYCAIHLATPVCDNYRSWLYTLTPKQAHNRLSYAKSLLQYNTRHSITDTTWSNQICEKRVVHVCQRGNGSYCSCFIRFLGSGGTTTNQRRKLDWFRFSCRLYKGIQM